MGIEQMSERDRMIDLTAPTERAFLIGLDNPGNGRWPVDRSLEELAALAETAGASVVGSAFQRRSGPDPVWSVFGVSAGMTGGTAVSRELTASGNAFSLDGSGQVPCFRPWGVARERR